MTARRVPPQLQPAKYDNKHLYAIRAVATGKASEHQQIIAMQWIIEQVAGTYQTSFSPDNHSLTDFAEGRRFVGTQIVKLINLDPEKLKKDDDNG